MATFRTNLSARSVRSASPFPLARYYQPGIGRHVRRIFAPNVAFDGGPRYNNATLGYDEAGNLSSSMDTVQVTLLTGTQVAYRTGTGPNVKAMYAELSQVAAGANVAPNAGYQATFKRYTYRSGGKLARIWRDSDCLKAEMSLACTTQAPAYGAQDMNEFYRYDALGRRVSVQTMTPTEPTQSAPTGKCAYRCDNTTRRTIWDGDHVLGEIRYPNAQADKDSGLDQENADAQAARDGAEPMEGTWENGVWVRHPYGGINTSRWAQSGRVLYVHGCGMDQPLGLVRMDYSYDFAAPVLIIPHANWRGGYETSTFASGYADLCKTVWVPSSEVVYQDSTGHMAAPAQGSDVQQTRCVERDFPGAYMGMTHQLKRQTLAGPTAWMGSLVQDGQDASGLSYRRNRYYDPNTGRFTQEDPSGLAGGLNVYGFGNGDPVSYSDPYGLKADSVKLDNRAAMALWNDVSQKVNAAIRSSDRSVRAAGLLLAQVMNTARDDPNHWYVISGVHGDASLDQDQGGAMSQKVGSTFNITVDVTPTPDAADASPSVLFTHELGAAVAQFHGGGHVGGAFAAENAARTIAGCWPRYRIFSDSWFNMPSCNW